MGGGGGVECGYVTNERMVNADSSFFGHGCTFWKKCIIEWNEQESKVQ